MSRYRKVGIYFFMFVLLALSGAAIIQRQAIYNQFNDWKLIPRPERLTELYFTDHTALPTTYAPGKQQDVAFTVHNIEYRTTTYNYVINQVSKDGTSTLRLAGGSFTLDQDKSRATETPVTVIDMGERAHIEVVITYDGIAFGKDDPSQQTQSVHYWVSKQHGAKLQL